jgi:CheY-like chemotaxis protein
MALVGHTILVVEDEPLIALAIVEDFKAAGASVHTAYNLSDGLRLADHPDLSAAVVDFGLSDGKGSALCERLNERQVPFILHTRGRSNSRRSHIGVDRRTRYCARRSAGRSKERRTQGVQLQARGISSAYATARRAI